MLTIPNRSGIIKTERENKIKDFQHALNVPDTCNTLRNMCNNSRNFRSGVSGVSGVSGSRV